MKTRAKKPVPAKAKGTEASINRTGQRLDQSVANPPQIFVLPEALSAGARIISLPSAPSLALSRYLICPDRGCYEFKRVSGPKTACKSWLLAPDRTLDKDSCEKADDERSTRSADDIAGSGQDQGYVLQAPDLLVATRIDPCFLLLPVLSQDGVAIEKQMYRSLSDRLDDLEERSEHFKAMMASGDREKVMTIFASQMSVICDSVQAGDEVLYRLSNEKLSAELMRKAQKMVAHGLPRGIDEQFVTQRLTPPVFNVTRDELDLTAVTTNSPTLQPANENSSAATSQETQESATTNTTSLTTASSVPESKSNSSTMSTSHYTYLLRVLTAFNFLLDSYVPAGLQLEVQRIRDRHDIIDFAPLYSHLNHIQQLKRKAQALQSMSDNISRKRGAYDDEESLEKAEAKKRKKEEDEIKKKNTSRGVTQLKKADTTGMKKMSSFFTKVAPMK